MQINGIARQLLSPLQFDTSNSSTAAGTATSAPAASVADTDVASLSPDFHEILSRYDVTNITPRQFTDLVQELHDSGEISDGDFRQLSRMRMELEQAGVGADDPISLVDFFEKKLKGLESDSPTPATDTPPSVGSSSNSADVAEANSQVNWIHKFALVHASGADGIDVGV